MVSILDFFKRRDPGSRFKTRKNVEQFNPSRLLADIKLSGVALTSTFEVLIFPPPSFNKNVTKNPETSIMGAPNRFAQDVLRLRVEQCDLPGRNVKTTDYVIGNQPLQSIGYGFTYAPINLMVLVSENLDEKVFFEQWQEIISNASDRGDDKYISNYYDDYVGQMIINQYDREGRKVYSAQCINAYPTLVNPIQLSWSDNQIMRLPVTIAYQSWKRIDHNPSGKGYIPEDIIIR